MWAIPVFAYSPITNTQSIPACFDWKGQVKTKVLEVGLDWNIVNEIIICESNWNYKAIGDHGTSFGLWQIHLPVHPNITKEEALDPILSTNYAIELIKRRGFTPWSCYTRLYP